MCKDYFFFFQAEDGIRDYKVTGVKTCALPIFWPHWKAVPGGWTAVEGVKGDKKTVLDYVDATWTDMRPKSLRVWMQQQEQAGAGAALQSDTDTVIETAAG